MLQKRENPNKEVIQSYLITSARYDFSVYEKRILYRIVELVQSELKGNSLGKGVQLQPTLYNDKRISMPFAFFLLDGEDKNHNRIHRAFKRLRQKGIDKTTQKGTIVGYPLIQYYEIPPYGDNITFQIAEALYKDLLDFAKGYSQYEIQVAFGFRSQYTMRLYELTCKNKRDITYSIESLREMFCLENKYKQTRDFLKYVINPAQRELEASKSVYYFIYEEVKTGKAITHLRFSTVSREKHKEPPLLPISDSADDIRLKELIHFLNKKLGTTNKNWLYHKQLLLANLKLSKAKRPENELDQILAGARSAENPVGYVVNALKGRIENTN